MNTSNRFKQLIEGLLISTIVIVTIVGASLLANRSTSAQPIVSPSPIDLSTSTAIPTATFTPTPRSIDLTPTFIQSATSTPTPTATPTITPTPCPIPSGWQPYTVGPFDTLISLSLRFNISADAIATANCLPNNLISLGQTIYLPPTATSTITTPTPTSAPCYPPISWAVYIVRPGDTLSGLAARYNLSVYQLQQANCLTSTFIYAGQILRVPFVFFTPTFTPLPTSTPTNVPTATPTATSTNTPAPTIEPTLEPTIQPTIAPTVEPTIEPTIQPTVESTITPTFTPTIEPPSPTPTDVNPPTLTPTDTPQPTIVPTIG